MQGINRSQDVYLDADGTKYGQVPIKVTCMFPDAKVTIGIEKIIDDDQDFVLENEMATQIINIMEESSSCTQSFKFDCSITLKNPVSKILYIQW